jgi:hypothetical protein
VAHDDIRRRHERRVVVKRRAGVVAGQVDGVGVMAAQAQLVSE